MTGPESSHILEKYFSNICISKQFWLGTLETGNILYYTGYYTSYEPEALTEYANKHILKSKR